MAKNSLKMGKKALCLIFAFLFSINTFAAVVSDNDGAAFITKAEFDSLKTTFQNVLNTYNSSIDNKIDSAISSYLSGVKKSSTRYLDNLINRVNRNSNDGYYVGDTWNTYGYRVMAKKMNSVTTQSPVGAILNFMMIVSFVDMYNDSAHSYAGTAIARLGLDFNARAEFQDRNRPSDSTYKTGKYLVCNEIDGVYYTLGRSSEVEYRAFAGLGAAGSMADVQVPKNETQRSTYQWGNPVFVNNNSFWSATTISVNVGWGTSTDHAEIRLYDAAFASTYAATERYITLPVAGSVSGSVVCLLNSDYPTMMVDGDYDEFTGYESRIVEMRQRSNFNNIILSNSNQVGLAENGVVKFKYNHHPYSSKQLSTIIDNTIYEATSEKAKLFNGIPLFKTDAAGKVKFKIKFYDVDNNDVYIGLSTKAFPNNQSGYVIDSDLHLSDADGNPYNTQVFESNREYTFVVDMQSDKTLWLKTYDTTDDYKYTGATIIGDIELKIEG